MRAFELLTEDANKLYYHGSGMDFDTFKHDGQKTNRAQNPSGVYLTPEEWDAEEYATDGFIYTVTTTANNPFVYDDSVVTDKMIELYSEHLKNNYGYGEGWVDSAIIPKYREDGRFKDIPGSVKTNILQSGGYDSWKDGRHLCVFDANDITIINKYKSGES